MHDGETPCFALIQTTQSITWPFDDHSAKGGKSFLADAVLVNPSTMRFSLVEMTRGGYKPRGGEVITDYISDADRSAILRKDKKITTWILEGQEVVGTPLEELPGDWVPHEVRHYRLEYRFPP